MVEPVRALSVLEYLSPREHEPPPGTILRLTLNFFGGVVALIGLLACLALMSVASTFGTRYLWSIPAAVALIFCFGCGYNVLKILRIDVYGGDPMDPRLDD